MLRLRLPLALSLLAGPTLLAACGGGGGGSSAIAGLLPPEQISVVTPVETAALPPSPPDFAADSDYEQDQARVHVYDPAIEPLQIVNMILCLVSQTGADQLVNEGPYLAQVNSTICDKGQDQSASATGQSSGAVDQFQLWTVDSARPSSTAPQSVHYWIPEEEQGEALTIFVDMLLTHGVDDQFPFGEFTLDFAGATDESALGSAVFGGALEANRLETGFSGFQLYFANGNVNQVPSPGDHAENTAATVVVRPDQQGGSARVRRLTREDFGSGDTGIISDEYQIAYDSTHFLRALNGGVPQAFHRDEFVGNVWRYNLYHASGPQAGERVELDSGFGFRTSSGDFGWIGYWGMWTPEGVIVASGDTITREEFGEAGESYTVFRAPGKLIRNTRRTLALAELGGQTFQWWYFDPTNGPTSYVVEYDVLTTVWQKIGTQAPGSPTINPIDPPQVIDTAALGFLNMWSQSLGGPTSYVDGETFVTYYAQQFVDGSDPVFAGGDLDLFGLVQCLRPDITGAEAEAGNVFLPDAPDVASPHSFSFSKDDLTLYLDEGSGLERVGLATGEAPQSGPFTWGMRSGPLVTSTAGLANVWDVWSATEFYVWETGANDWNQFTRVIDSGGAFVQFDAPITFTYVQASGDDRNGDDSKVGQTYFLNYGGPGQLWGLPQEGVDLNADGQPDRWYPVVNLADGVLLGPTGTEYVVKGLEIEQTLAPDPAYAGALDLDDANALVIPSGSLYTTPDIGPAPVVTDPPRVVQGVVVSGP
jgi:hypothetical protein